MKRGAGGAGLVEKARGGLEERLALMAPSRRLRLALAEHVISGFAGAAAVRVLDAGCGDGLLSLSLAQRHPTWQVAGLDFSERLLSGGRRRAHDRGLTNITFDQADLTLPLPESDFDVVMAIECLTEIPDDRRALQSMVDALRPGGLFVVQVPDRRWKPILPGSPARWREEVRHGYSSEALASLLSETGLTAVEITPTFHSAVAVAQEVRDRVKDSPLVVRLALFPFLAASVRLERWGFAWGKSNAFIATARRPGTA